MEMWKPPRWREAYPPTAMGMSLMDLAGAATGMADTLTLRWTPQARRPQGRLVGASARTAPGQFAIDGDRGH